MSKLSSQRLVISLVEAQSENLANDHDGLRGSFKLFGASCLLITPVANIDF
jgi:hypothetical protein